MKTKRTISLLTLLVLAGVVAALAPAASSSTQASLVIRHETRGCHSWSLNGGAYGTNQTVAIRRGGSVSVTNNDVMPHKLVQTSGPAVVYTRLASGNMMGLKGTFPPATLARMGASSRITFAKAGVYRFTTKPGADYMAGIKTVGADNVLQLTVRVK
jgi:plastocyanin